MTPAELATMTAVAAAIVDRRPLPPMPVEAPLRALAATVLVLAGRAEVPATPHSEVPLKPTPEAAE